MNKICIYLLLLIMMFIISCDEKNDVDEERQKISMNWFVGTWESIDIIPQPPHPSGLIYPEHELSGKLIFTEDGEFIHEFFIKEYSIPSIYNPDNLPFFPPDYPIIEILINPDYGLRYKGTFFFDEINKWLRITVDSNTEFVYTITAPTGYLSGLKYSRALIRKHISDLPDEGCYDPDEKQIYLGKHTGYLDPKRLIYKKIE